MQHDDRITLFLKKLVPIQSPNSRAKSAVLVLTTVDR